MQCILLNTWKEMAAASVMIAIVCALPVLPAAAQVRSSAHYEIEDEVVAGGGNASSSATYSNTSTTAQFATVGLQDSATYENQSGFWHTILTVPPIPAVSAMGIGCLILIFSGFIYRRKSMQEKGIS